MEKKRSNMLDFLIFVTDIYTKQMKITITLTICLLLAQCISAANVLDFSRKSGVTTMLSNDITALTQDKNGFIWVASRKEIARFDGQSFIPINPEFNRRLFSNDNVVHCMQTVDGSIILIGTETGLFSYDTCNDSFHMVEGLEWLHIHAIKDFGKTGSYLLNSNTGLLLYNTSDSSHKNIIPYSPAIEAGNFNSIANIAINGEIIYLSDSRHLLSTKITAEGNVSHIDTLMTLKSSHSITVDDSGHLYIYNRNELKSYHLDGMTEEISIPIEVTAFILWEDDVVVGERGSGVKKFRSGCAHLYDNIRFSEHFDDMSGTANTFFKDCNENLWVGTKNGIFMIEKRHKNPFNSVKSSIGSKNSLSHNTVNDIKIDENERVWIATPGGLDILSFISSDNEKYHITNIKDNEAIDNEWRKIEQISFAPDGNVWLGTKAGVRFIDPTTMRFKKNPALDRAFADCDFVRALYRSKDDAMWVGFNNGGLFRYAGDNIEQIEAESIESCTSICGGTENLIYAGTKNQGLMCISMYENRIIGKYPLDGRYVSCIYMDSRGHLYCGTGNGLLRYIKEKDTFEDVQISYIGDKPYISGIIEDNDGNLWVSTTSGLYRVSRTDGTMSVYRLKGIARKGFVYGCAKDSDGRIWLSGVDGLNWFHPDEVTADCTECNLSIINVKVNDVAASIGSEILPAEINSLTSITLPHHSNVEFSVSALNCFPMENILYAYRLEERDTSWNYVSSDICNLIFKEMKAGEYTLRVKSTNSAGIWQNNEKVLKINVRPSAFVSWYAILCYFISAIAAYVLLGIYKNAKRKQKRDKEFIRKQILQETIMSPKEISAMSDDERFLSKAMDIVETNISNEDFSVDFFASAMCMSNSMLYRRIKSLTDMSPHDFYRSVRMKRAAQLLKTKAYTISEVAMMVGFSDARYFSTCFKKEFNQTPTTYVKSCSEEKNNLQT